LGEAVDVMAAAELLGLVPDLDHDQPAGELRCELRHHRPEEPARQAALHGGFDHHGAGRGGEEPGDLGVGQLDALSGLRAHRHLGAPAYATQRGRSGFDPRHVGTSRCFSPE
jgi:hypothetical protein